MNGFLLDTNIPSELVRTRPEPRVANWVYTQDEQSLHLSAVTIGELRRGFVTMIAATAIEHDLTVVTRNVRDFAALGVRIFNPWD